MCKRKADAEVNEEDRDVEGVERAREVHGRRASLFARPLCGRVVEGSVRDGVLNGHGVVVQSQGTVFDGHWRANEFVHGVVRFANGGVYRGEWHNGSAHGQGVKTLPCGDVYAGAWLDGLSHGFGTELKVSGQRYEGFFRQGVKQGDGVLTLPCGDTYSGEWADGSLHGFGTKTTRGSVYSGFFDHGFKHGYGWEKDAHGVYFGRFHQNERSGYGVQTSAGEFKGMWRENAVNGSGVWRDESSVISGEFKDGLMHGHGVAQFADSTHEGMWCKGVKHGPGMVSLPCGDTLTGVWRDGKLLTPDEACEARVAEILCGMRCADPHPLPRFPFFLPLPLSLSLFLLSFIRTKLFFVLFRSTQPKHRKPT